MTGNITGTHLMAGSITGTLLMARGATGILPRDVTHLRGTTMVTGTPIIMVGNITKQHSIPRLNQAKVHQTRN